MTVGCRLCWSIHVQQPVFRYIFGAADPLKFALSQAVYSQQVSEAMATSMINVLTREPLFEDVCSVDFLNFKFGGRGYQVSTAFMQNNT
jgi:hypothetical protein